ncbi:hypothetical protein [Streptomyces jumonjinensis]|uniref:hypothetical protein n=1 Tax=Streptomyces jumonjinensis TaxID=1945 RepID=UPI0037A92254
MPQQLPHDPYITAVIDALTAAGLAPTEWWTSDTEIDPYRDDDYAGVACMLTAVLLWDDEHPALTRGPRYGIGLVWDHPAEQWQWAPRAANGHFDRDPDFLPRLGRYSHPDTVTATVRALLAGTPLPDGCAPYWRPADSVRIAVEAWAAVEIDWPSRPRLSTNEGMTGPVPSRCVIAPMPDDPEGQR